MACDMYAYFFGMITDIASFAIRTPLRIGSDGICQAASSGTSSSLGCYMYGRPDHYGNTALALAEGRTPFYWSKQKSDLLAETFSRNSVGTTADRPWSFTGPLELVVVGARRYGEEVEFEWPGLRAIQLSDKPLGQVVADYTEAHVQNDAGLLSPGLPARRFPGRCYLPTIFFGVAHLMPFVGKAFHAYRIVRAID